MSRGLGRLGEGAEARVGDPVLGDGDEVDRGRVGEVDRRRDVEAGQAVALDLADGLQLRRSRLMQVNRIELTGFGSTAVDRLKAMGLFSEIISWKLRLFVPDDVVTGSAVIERLFERHPLARIADRKAA